MSFHNRGSQEGLNAGPIVGESTFMQKVNYIHQNSVHAGLAARSEDYCWSSARFWKKCPDEEEPLRVDINEIIWRRS